MGCLNSKESTQNTDALLPSTTPVEEKAEPVKVDKKQEIVNDLHKENEVQGIASSTAEEVTNSAINEIQSSEKSQAVTTAKDIAEDATSSALKNMPEEPVVSNPAPSSSNDKDASTEETTRVPETVESEDGSKAVNEPSSAVPSQTNEASSDAPVEPNTSSIANDTTTAPEASNSDAVAKEVSTDVPEEERGSISERRSSVTEGVPQGHIRCVTCEEVLPKKNFSANQQKKKKTASCKQCIERKSMA